MRGEKKVSFPSPPSPDQAREERHLDGCLVVLRLRERVRWVIGVNLDSGIDDRRWQGPFPRRGT